MAGSEFGELADAALTIALATGLIFIILFTNMGSIENVGNNISRLMYALVHTLAPTSAFDLVIEAVVSLFGFLTVSKLNVGLGILVAFFLYFATSFVIAFFSAPAPL